MLLPLDGSDVALSIIPTAQRLLEPYFRARARPAPAPAPPVEVHLLTILDPARATGQAESELVHVTTPSVGGLLVTAPVPRMVESHGQAMERLHREAQEALEAVAARHFAGASAVAHVRWSDSPVEAILEFADELDADMILMATHGRSGVSHLLAGSVAEGVIRRSRRPVVVQRPPG